LASSAALRSLIEARRGEATLGVEAVLRRLAAIGAADVPGYLRLSEAHEEGALAPGSPRHCPIDPTIALRKGRAPETAGAVEAAPIAAS
jgi:hypothetical protein